MTGLEKAMKIELMSFIVWKLSHNKEYLKEVRSYLETLSYTELRNWAIKNDIVDE